MRIERRSELLAAHLQFLLNNVELMQWQPKAPKDIKRLINAGIAEFSMNIRALPSPRENVIGEEISKPRGYIELIIILSVMMIYNCISHKGMCW